LFVREAFVDRQENFKTARFRDREEFAILLASEAGLRDGLAVVIDEAVLEFSRNTLVDENFHPSWRTSEDLANSRAAIAASRVTVGKSSRNSSRSCPPSK